MHIVTDGAAYISYTIMCKSKLFVERNPVSNPSRNPNGQELTLALTAAFVGNAR